MSGIRLAESGTTQGNYTARNPSGAFGAYQFMPQYWEDWSAGAGIAGASIEDPAAQDRTARWLMNKYYTDYGAWDMVAAAWRLGPGVANRIQSEGWGALTTVERSKIEPYLQKVMPFTGTSAYQSGPTGAPTDLGGDPAEEPNSILVQMFDGMSRKVAGGQRMSANDLLGTTTATEASLEGAGASGGSTNTLDQTMFSDEGSETYDPTAEGQSWNSSSEATHTYATNEERLNDPGYQSIAQNLVAPIGDYLAKTFGVSVGQYRDLGTRPSGGAEFSDHYWGGALDISGTEQQMQQVADWAEANGEQIGVNYKLWQVENHYDHVHLSFLPPASEGAVLDASTALLQTGIVQPPQVLVPANIMPTTPTATTVTAQRQPSRTVTPQEAPTTGGRGYG